MVARKRQSNSIQTGRRIDGRVAAQLAPMIRLRDRISIPRYVRRVPRIQLVMALLAVVVVVGFTARLISHHLAYNLSPATTKLVASTNATLAKKLSYDEKSSSFLYNKSALAKSAKPNSPQAALAAAGQSKKVGGGANNYAVKLAAASSEGVTVHDTSGTTDLALTLTPQFHTLDAKMKAGRIIYPISGSPDKLIYTAKANGLKEDLIIPTEHGDTTSFAYTMKLPNTLEAKLTPNGEVGIYSADPALFGDISYGSDADRTKVEAARKNGAKTHLAFVIPAPTIIQTGKGSTTPKAHFKLDGTTLTVVASGLTHASYPLSIDPSIVVTSASDFAGGNLEGGIEIDTTNNQLKRGGLTGGTISPWHYTYNSADNNTTFAGGLNTNHSGHGTVAYNGYLYAIGGDTAGATQTNATEYAPINTNGTIGTWATTSSFTNARSQHNSTVYNGYIYVIGGQQGSSNIYNDVQYARVNSNGSLGAWQTDTGGNFSTPRYSQTTAVYNGYMYVIGGCTSIFTACNSVTNDVQYAPINADGSIGTWASAGTFSSGRYGHTSIVFNNFLYIMGGATGGVTPIGYSDVQYTAISADGSLGSWISTNALPVNTSLATAVVNSGYVYVIGGTQNVNSTLYARISADGSIGVWGATSTLIGGRRNLTSAVYNGYIYMTGGYDDPTLSYHNDVQFAKIDPAGVAGVYGTTTAYDSTTRCQEASTAYNGYLYVVGGISNCSGGGVNTIRYAPLNTDGTVGTWANASTYSATGRFSIGVVAYNGYLYAIGGDNAGSTEVDYAPVNANGTLGTFTVGNSLATGRGKAGVAAINGYLYIFGGVNTNNSNLLASVEYSVIGANGAPGTWATTTSLATARRDLSATAAGGYVYISGGNGPSGNLNDVQYALVCTGLNNGSQGCGATAGTLGTWKDANSGANGGSGSSYPNIRSGLAMVAYNGYLYVTGGASDTSGTVLYSDTQRAVLNANGSLGSWSATTSFSTARYRHSTAIYGGYIYVIGGCTAAGLLDACNTGTADVQYAPINNGGSGSAGAWTTNSTSFTGVRSGHTSVVYNGYIYILGGYNGTSYLSDVQYATLNSNGSIGTWGTTTSFTTPRQGHSSVVYNGYIYVAGGSTGSSIVNDVQYAPINAGGTVGAWTPATSFSTVRYFHSMSVYNGYLYIMGGCSSILVVTCTGYQNDTQYVAISANGSLGSWSTTNTFTTARYGQTSVVNNGYIYILGGYTGTYSSDVQYAPINSNGTLGTWNATNGFNIPRYGHSSYFANGYVYIAGGSNNGGVVVNDTQYAPIFANGTLGAWSATSNFSTGRFEQASIAYNGYTYITGGQTATGSPTFYNDVQYAGLQSTPRRGTYSTLLDLEGDAVGTKLLYRGTGTNNSLTRKSAPATTAAFGAASTTPTLTSNALISLSNTENRYRQLSFTLDDSQNSVFPDSLSPTATLTDFELFFHAAPTTRLRGGKTFTGGAQRGLDVTPN